MKLLFVHSHVFKYNKNKEFYSEGKLTYSMWEERYLKYFDQLIVAARASKINKENLNLSSGPNVKHYILPNLSNIKNRRISMKKLKKDLKYLIKSTDVLVARIPSEHALQAIKIAKKLKKPYVVEVVGDGFAALWTHGSLIGKILAPISYLKYKKITKQASHLIYVTEHFLQTRYPSNINANSINASNVELSSVSTKVLNERIKKIKKLNLKKEIKIGLIGSYSSKYKGIDTAIKSIKHLNNSGYNCKLVILGDGDNKWLRILSQKMNIEEKIIFANSLPGGNEVFNWLDSLDIYIQPSLTEGLPRALIEAMSRGLPCVVSSAGGMPELISDDFIHKPKSVKALSNKIEVLLEDKKNMLSQSKKNYTHAKKYTTDVLNERRNNFWIKFKNKEF